MTSCLTLLHSIADTERVLVCAGGQNWAGLALTGLAFVLGLAFVAAVLWLALRWETGR